MALDLEVAMVAPLLPHLPTAWDSTSNALGGTGLDAVLRGLRVCTLTHTFRNASSSFVRVSDLICGGGIGWFE